MSVSQRCTLPREATLTLRPRDFVETEQNTFVMQGLADQITAFRRDMGIVLAEDLPDAMLVFREIAANAATRKGKRLTIKHVPSTVHP